MSRAQFLAMMVVASVPLWGAIAVMAQEATAPVDDQVAMDFGIGGVGGAYFLAEPGKLVVEVEKRDRHARDRHTELRAILLGPDRKVLGEATIPDDGKERGSGPGAPQRVTLSTQVARKGVYALNITVSQDRYGDEIIWGLRTNCAKYLVETSGGHRDSRHLEPIRLWDDDKPADVCFMPPDEDFAVEVSGLPRQVASVSLFDAAGDLIRDIPTDKDGKATHRVPAGDRSRIPWRLHVPQQHAVVHIDGVTRWESRALNENLSLWTPKLDAWFPFRQYRWLLTPYSRLAYGEAGADGALEFQVHNNSLESKAVDLALEFPGDRWPAKLSHERVTVAPRKGFQVTVNYRVPDVGQEQVCHLRATPVDSPDFTTYSTLTVREGVAPADGPIPNPLVLKAYEHENELFGYLPPYPLNSQMYFDAANRPFAIEGGGIATSRDGEWLTTALSGNVRSDDPELAGASFRPATSKLAFDRQGGAYLLARTDEHSAYLHSTDGCKTFTAYLIAPGSGGFDIDQFSGHNLSDGPPPFIRIRRTSKGTHPRLRWRSINDLEVFAPKMVDGKIQVGEGVMVSKMCIGLSSHSGIPSSVVSRGSKVHVAWGEATDPEKKVPGVPQYVATYDRETGKLSTPALIGYGPPANDVHNSPSITMDSRGYLHVLLGTHGRPFQYARSLEPNDAGAGWTEAETVGKNLGQTYIGLVCGTDDTLHVVFRMWRSGVEPFPKSSHATLAYQRKRPGQPWEDPKVLVVAPFSEYSIFYHRLTIDQKGRLFISKDYWSTFWFYRMDHQGNRRSLIMSEDGGDTWRLAGGQDLGY